ncbi:MAG: glutamate mutase L, partial [Planctomycetota bacterium]|nr:glutamate mutase L [Planctomycetota bacterium]
MAEIKPEALNVILATDCGSTTTKAILIERRGSEYRQTYRGEAPTTVEAPFDDVTVGVRNAVAEIEEISGRRLLDADGGILTPARDQAGVDIYVSTSSAGGGLQMAVAGLVRAMTAESAARAALGAGAIVMETIAIDDGRKPHERVALIRHLRPDIFLIAGGTDGGNKTHVVEIAEMLLAADPRPRFGSGFRLPVIYAGNRDAAAEVGALLSSRFAFEAVANLRPALEVENLGPARAAIHEAFLHHVMSHAPGYDKLMSWSPVPIMSTPHAVGKLTEEVAQRRGINVLAVDIGGTTTDVFSVFDGVFNRTVSANLGMSYSVCNVLLETGIDNVVRWLASEVSAEEAAERLRNKMIRPTTIPQTLEDLELEQAVAREALRLALEHHRQLAVGLKGIQQQRSVADAFAQTGSGQTLVDMMRLDLLIGSGGVLSHAPQRAQAALMMLDAFAPAGFTELAVDSIFMMPHLGVLSTVHPAAAAEVFEKDCLIPLGTALAPAGEIR